MSSTIKHASLIADVMMARVGRCYVRFDVFYRDRLKGLYVVARNFFLLLLNFSAWPCLGPA